MGTSIDQFIDNQSKKDPSTGDCKLHKCMYRKNCPDSPQGKICVDYQQYYEHLKSK